MTQPPPLVHRDSVLHAIFVWAIVLAAVAYSINRNVHRGSSGRSPTTNSAAAAPENLQFTVAAKYVLGVHHLAHFLDPQTRAHFSDAQYMKSLDDQALTKREKIDAAIIAGEVLSNNAARKRLENIDDPDAAAFARVYDSATTRPSYPALPAHGFFTLVATSHGKPDADPLRASVFNSAMRAAIFLFSAGVAMLFLGIFGFCLLVLFCVWRATGKIQSAYHRQPRAPLVYLEMFAIYLVSFIGISLILGSLLRGSPSLAWEWIAGLCLPIALMWGFARGENFSQIRDALGWRDGRGFLIEIFWGLVGYIGGLPIVAAGFAITYFLIHHSHATPTHPITNMPTNTPADILQLFGIACVFAPIVEESMFRGALFHHLRRKWNWWFSAGLVALIFAAIHPQGWTLIPVLGSIAIVLAILREWRGSIISSMTAHACNNFLVLCLLLAVK